jgi:hypothetical protein
MRKLYAVIVNRDGEDLLHAITRKRRRSQKEVDFRKEVFGWYKSADDVRIEEFIPNLSCINDGIYYVRGAMHPAD